METAVFGSMPKQISRAFNWRRNGRHPIDPKKRVIAAQCFACVVKKGKSHVPSTYDDVRDYVACLVLGYVNCVVVDIPFGELSIDRRSQDDPIR